MQPFWPAGGVDKELGSDNAHSRLPPNDQLADGKPVGLHGGTHLARFRVDGDDGVGVGEGFFAVGVLGEEEKWEKD